MAVVVWLPPGLASVPAATAFPKQRVAQHLQRCLTAKKQTPLPSSNRGRLGDQALVVRGPRRPPTVRLHRAVPTAGPEQQTQRLGVSSCAVAWQRGTHSQIGQNFQQIGPTNQRQYAPFREGMRGGHSIHTATENVRAPLGEPKIPDWKCSSRIIETAWALSGGGRSVTPCNRDLLQPQA